MAIALAPATTALRVAVYRRVSRQQQADNYSLGAQLKDCQRLAAELGTEVVADFQDVDSGAGWDLPGLNAMLDAARRREFSLLITADMDRLARGMAKQLAIEGELKRQGVTVQYVNLRLGHTPEDGLMKNMRASIAEYERERIKIRTQTGKREKASRGLVMGGHLVAYGYRFVRDGKGRPVGLEIDPETAPIARRIVRELSTRTLEQVCEGLDADGIPAPWKAKRWTSGTIGHMLVNPTYLGRYYFGRVGSPDLTRHQYSRLRRETDEGTYAEVPAVWTVAELEAARRGMAERSRLRKPRHDVDSYILRGLLNCAHCGGALACHAAGDGLRRYYLCLRHHAVHARRQGRARCSLPLISAQALEGHVWDILSATLLDPDYLRVSLARALEEDQSANQRAERLTTVKAEIDRRRKRLDRATIERLDADPGSEAERTLTSAIDITQQEIRRLTVELGQVEASMQPLLTIDDVDAMVQFAEDVAAGLAGASPERQRWVYETMRLRATVTLDEERGEKIGRDHRFTFEWSSPIPLRDKNRQALAGGVTTSLALDPHGKTRSSLILDLPVDVPDGYVPPRLR